MRSSPLALALASTVLLVGACGDPRHDESAVSRSRDSSLTHDLQTARGDTGAMLGAPSVRSGAVVAESPGSIEPSQTGVVSVSPAGSPARNASNPAVASADGYVGASCASPALDDQRRCLNAYLARSDEQLDRNYDALIRRLKDEVGTSTGGAEPPTVQRLRASQRAWVAYRDEECRKRSIETEGPLWAPVRAECLAQYSSLRARELGDALAKRPAVESRPKTTTPKRSSARKTTRSRSRRHR